MRRPCESLVTTKQPGRPGHIQETATILGSRSSNEEGEDVGAPDEEELQGVERQEARAQTQQTLWRETQTPAQWDQRIRLAERGTSE